jgi:phosphoglycolate phosphatase-like HAD superfamily hydrolase
LANNSPHESAKARGKGPKLFEWTKKQKLKSKEVMVVGDTDEEIEIGKHYGFWTVALTGGYNSTPRLRVFKPDFLIHNLMELEGIIKKLNKGNMLQLRK